MRIHEHGGADKMRWETVDAGDPGPGQVRVRNTAVGLNFVDIYQRSGLYPMQLPFTLGSEGAGVVEAVGPKVKELKAGDRVAYSGPLGAYAEVVLRPADRLVKIPAGLDEKTAAAMMLKGLTAQYLIRRTYRVKKGDTIVMHAAAGGVGQIARVVRLGVFVNSADGFTDQPKVANGASDLLMELFGDDGRHARAAVGTNALPLNACVEVEFLFHE